MSSSKAAVTVNRPRGEVERLWEAQRPVDGIVVFEEAPGDRGTEIHVEVSHGLLGGARRAKAKDALRHFKQRVETGEIPRSDAVPEGERAERKLKQRPAQPLEPAGVS